MTDKEGTGFSEDYVKELRSENASWRTKYRELEAQLGHRDVEVELIRRGVTAKAEWVTRNPKQSVEDAVDKFLESYPQFAQQETQEEPETQETLQKNKPKPMVTIKSPTNTKGPKAQNGLLGGKTMKEIKEDPTSRAALRSQYRALLHSQGHQNYQGE